MTIAPVVSAVVVSFNPDLERFQELLDATVPQVDHLVVVDNGSREDVRQWLRDRLEALAPCCEWLPLDGNRGVAAAQNRGIERARLRIGSATNAAVLLLDHDSVPASNMVARLGRALLDLQERGLAVAAVGANFLDERQKNPPPFVQVRGLRFKRVPCPNDDCVNEVSYLIASGSLTPLSTFDAIGPMDEGLFIDYVDTEWGLRAGSRGYRCFGVCGAHMSHDLGDSPVRLGRRRIAIHSPIRHYYMARNAILLYRRPDLPFDWKRADATRLVIRLGFYLLFAPPRHQQLRMILRGLFDGMRGRRGGIEFK